MAFEIDTIDSDDLVIGLVQIPPGKSSEELLDTSNPLMVKFLKKFFKRLGKNPGRSFSKPLPMNHELETFSFSTKDSASVHIPFVGKGSGGRWFLRHFPTQRLTLQQYDNTLDTVLAVPPEEQSSQIEHILSRESTSPQLITSSDEEYSENYQNGLTS
ncbi:hypothetical protein D915_003620 [Fasciola hepatica]|uniref:Uncharacterized protein n=1 Tax=Fasciola hepatica TaxID=6192 RepID=A0A4E0RDN5_FASHE|nr:hypothetical protein D915_003620 [Fasciola hepatica]